MLEGVNDTGITVMVMRVTVRAGIRATVYRIAVGRREEEQMRKHIFVAIFSTLT
jgi:hypothetical protein